MLKINYELKKYWPKLAWVAVLYLKSNVAKIMHGSMVEVQEDWAIEGVWDGAFADGSFDRTDLIFGSGIRQRGKELVFVSSGTGVDRLWYVDHGDKTFVSNTLPGLLKVSELSLQKEYEFYISDIASIQRKGLYSYIKKIPSDGSDICVVYFKNLLWCGRKLVEVEKPDNAPFFSGFHSYEKYLQHSAKHLGKNARSPLRKHNIEMLVGLSSGYDSVAAAVVSQYAGCKKAASIINSSSLWRGSDSGEQIAQQLGLDCQTVTHNKSKYREEISVWAASGNSGGRNLTFFEYPKPLCLFFSGGYGDTIWDRHHQGLQEPKGGVNDLLCEFRLIEGVFFTVVPWWGIQKAKDIQKINLLEEMKPWTLGTDYDRPIARRLAEDAGIKRGTFAIRKKDTASNEPFWWPSTNEAINSLNSFLIAHDIKPLSKIKSQLFSVFCKILKIIYKNVLYSIEGTKICKRLWRPWLTRPERHILFVWANHVLRDKYYR